MTERTYENILVETRPGSGAQALSYGWITLNRPKALNALNDGLMDELGEALLAFDADDSIACVVVTGSEKAFAAGADISVMHPFDFPNAFRKGLISRNWDTIRQVRALIEKFVELQVEVQDTKAPILLIRAKAVFTVENASASWTVAYPKRCAGRVPASMRAPRRLPLRKCGAAGQVRRPAADGRAARLHV